MVNLGLFTILTGMCGCSPAYVMRAGWEEARILWGRQPLAELIRSPDIDETLRQKFKLVLEARDFAAKLQLKPGGSFTQYSAVERDDLIWVLSAAPKLSLQSVTWWFPVVGRVPYKGYFVKKQGEEAALELKEEGFDVFLRSSPAFSTLGWFDDPLLSTTVKYDDITLVNTVVHEIVHNTVWFKGNVSFNECLANFVGGAAAVEFFRRKQGEDSMQVRIAEALWHDELIYAEFISETTTAFESFYAAARARVKDSSKPPPEVLAERERLFAEAAERWEQRKGKLRSPEFKNRKVRLNNAVLIANRVYLEQMWLFADLFRLRGNSLEKFIADMVLIRKEVDKSGRKPFEVLREHNERIMQEQPEAQSGTSGGTAG